MAGRADLLGCRLLTGRALHLLSAAERYTLIYARIGVFWGNIMVCICVSRHLDLMLCV